jgi:tRNA(Ile2) C34 agmatinyltransferase TiaS
MLAGSGVGSTVVELVVIAILLLLVLQLIAFAVVRLVRSQRCPRCGKRVKAGRQECDSCGFDFREAEATLD